MEPFGDKLQLKFNIPTENINKEERKKRQSKIVDTIKKRKVQREAGKPSKKPKVVMRHPVNVIMPQEKFLPLIVTVAVRQDCDGLLVAKNRQRREQYSKGKKKVKVAQKYRSIVSSKPKQEQATDIIKRASVVEVRVCCFFFNCRCKYLCFG